MVNRVTQHTETKLEDEYIHKSKYRRHLRRAKASTSYFLYFRAYAKLIGKLEALFLQDLINREEMVCIKQAERDKLKSKKRRMVDNEEYFLCTAAFLSNSKYSLVWSIEEQKRLLNVLLAKGYIKTKRKGMPPRRWIMINYDLMEEQLDALEP